MQKKKTRNKRNHKTRQKRKTRYNRKSRGKNNQNGGIIMSLAELYPGDLTQEGPFWLKICNSVPNKICNTLVKTIIPPYLYGSSMPILTDRKKLEDLFKFYMFRKEINVIISLQACGDLNYPPQRICIASDRSSEERTWEQMKQSNPDTADDPNIQFHNEYIRDLSAGTLVRWTKLLRHKINNPKQKTMIHCLAGFGRTGSVLLLNIIRYMIKNNNLDKSGLSEPFLTYEDSESMYRGLAFDILNNTMITDDNGDENDPYNSRIIEFDSRYVVRELFAFNTPFKANLLISRINLILLMVSYSFLEEGTNIYLYSVHPNSYVPSIETLFVPILCELNKTSLITLVKENSASNVYGIVFE